MIVCIASHHLMPDLKFVMGLGDYFTNVGLEVNHNMYYHTLTPNIIKIWTWQHTIKISFDFRVKSVGFPSILQHAYLQSLGKSIHHNNSLSPFFR